MSLYPWKKWENKSLGKSPCTEERDTWICPNMLPVKDDRSFTHEHYECKMCGKRHALDYDEIR